MNNNVIYYPYIEVPQNEWFTRVLLYWDKINPIVPIGYRPSDYMYSLLDYELIEPIHPYECHSIRNFDESFLNYVDNRNYPVSRYAIEALNSKITKIHVQKLESIGNELVNRGLARKSRNNGWYDVESYTANQFMAYMAGTLSIQNKCTPITDTTQHLYSFEPRYHSKGNINQDLDQMRTKILNILPAPTNEIDAEEISFFKDEHRNELSNFRKKIERTLQEASLIKDAAQRNEFIDRFILNSKYKVEDLSESLQSRGWNNISYGSLVGLAETTLGLSASIAASALLPAIAAAFGTVDRGLKVASEFKNTNNLDDDFVTYAVLAQQQF